MANSSMADSTKRIAPAADRHRHPRSLSRSARLQPGSHRARSRAARQRRQLCSRGRRARHPTGNAGRALQGEIAEGGLSRGGGAALPFGHFFFKCVAPAQAIENQPPLAFLQKLPRHLRRDARNRFIHLKLSARARRSAVSAASRARCNACRPLFRSNSARRNSSSRNFRDVSSIHAQAFSTCAPSSFSASFRIAPSISTDSPCQRIKTACDP